MAVSAFKTWVAGEVLTASDLNSSFTQVFSNGEDLAWPATKAKDLDGQQLQLDADADTIIVSDSDDTIDFDIGGLASALKFVHLASGSGATSMSIQDTLASSAAGPTLTLWRNSASPADSDFIGDLLFDGEDDGGNQTTFARLLGRIVDTTDTTEDGALRIYTMQDGTLTQVLDISTAFEVSNSSNFTVTSGGDLTLVDTDAGPGLGPIVTLYRNSASPNAQDNLGEIAFYGEEGTSGDKMQYSGVSGEIVDQTDGSIDGGVRIRTAVAGTLASRFRFQQGLFSENATGGDQGGDTINASAVYDDGTGPLTDYVLDYAANGKINLDLYDEASVWASGRNEPARRFMANTDELDIDVYLSKCLTNLTLPSMPALAERLERKHALGELVQGLWEAAEVAAVQRGDLHQRIARIEEVLAL